jgi:uncharacterized repeat protein (TIGR01451 family)
MKKRGILLAGKNILGIAFMMLIGSSGAYAAGTTAGTQIQNSVTVSYSVALIPQTPIVADDGSGFLVDKKIDFTVTNDDTNQIAVNPGAQDQITNWTLTNTSNTAQYFTLAASNLATGKTVYSDADTGDDTGTQTIYYSTDGGTSYSPYTGAISIVADGSIKVQVRSDIPLTVANGDVMNIQLLATATDSVGTPETATAGADTASIDTVLADGTGDASYEGTAYDGKYQVWGGYQVESAALSVTKGSCVIWDPVNLSNGNQKRIPNAVVRYTIEVHNNGVLPGTSVIAQDILPSEVTYGTTSPAPTAVHLIATEPCNCASPGVSNGDTVSESGGTVTADFGTVSALTNTYECAYFDVTIN